MNESERKEYLTQFGSRVKELRKNKGMTQLELAVKAGYTDGAKVTGFEPVNNYRLKPR